MNKIRVNLASYDHRLLQKTIARIINAVEPTGAKVSGSVALKTKKEIITVLRSPHVNKNSREQFVQHTYRRFIDVDLPIITESTVKALRDLALPMGVDASIKQPR